MELLRMKDKYAQIVLHPRGVEIKQPLEVTSVCHLNCDSTEQQLTCLSGVVRKAGSLINSLTGLKAVELPTGLEAAHPDTTFVLYVAVP